MEDLCCCLSCLSLFYSIFLSHQDFLRLLLNVSHGGAPASRDVRLGGASAPSVGSLGGAAGRFDFERSTSDSTLLNLIVFFRFSLAVAESFFAYLFFWREDLQSAEAYLLILIVECSYCYLAHWYLLASLSLFVFVDDSVSWISSPRYFRSNF